MRDGFFGKLLSYLRHGCVHKETVITSEDGVYKVKCIDCGTTSDGIKIEDRITHRRQRLARV